MSNSAVWFFYFYWSVLFSNMGSLSLASLLGKSRCTCSLTVCKIIVSLAFCVLTMSTVNVTAHARHPPWLRVTHFIYFLLNDALCTLFVSFFISLFVFRLICQEIVLPFVVSLYITKNAQLRQRYN